MQSLVNAYEESFAMQSLVNAYEDNFATQSFKEDQSWELGRGSVWYLA
ncbi:MAG TPA: hypothetical protein VGI33_04220 [Paenibacillus sp.]|jgi:hypothetical protein